MLSGINYLKHKPMRPAFEKLSGNGMVQGVKSSQTVTTEQQAKPAAQINQETFKGLMNGTIKPSAPSHEPEAKKPEQSPIINQSKSYADMFAELNKGMVESPEQQKNREKKERTDAIVRSVGDGLSALSRMYFATKGAVSAHNPQNDLTAISNKRKEYLQQQREKNKAAWLTGYQRALALDEEARKNNMTAAEAFRYHNMLNDAKGRAADQADTRLEQNQQKLDLTKYKYDTDKDFKDAQLKIKQQLADGQITYWQAKTAIGEMAEARNGAKGGSSSGSGKAKDKVDYDREWVTINQKDPNGAQKSSEFVSSVGMDPTKTAGRKQAVKHYNSTHKKSGKAQKGNWASGLSLKNR